MTNEPAEQLEMKPGFNVRPLKRVYTTVWSETAVMVVDRLTFSQEQFFEPAYSTGGGGKNRVPPVRHMLHPDSVPFRELRAFIGKKTRITIEVVE